MTSKLLEKFADVAFDPAVDALGADCGSLAGLLGHALEYRATVALPRGVTLAPFCAMSAYSSLVSLSSFSTKR
jgi:hypothetical protein